MSTVGEYLEYRGGYHEYRGGISWVPRGISWVPWGNILSTVGGVQYRGGYHDKCGNILSTVGDIMSTVGVILSTVKVILSTVGDIQYRGDTQYCGGYHEYRRGCLVPWGEILLLFEYPMVLNTPTVLMISPTVLSNPHSTQDTPHTVLMIFPSHPPRYWTPPRYSTYPPRYWTSPWYWAPHGTAHSLYRVNWGKFALAKSSTSKHFLKERNSFSDFQQSYCAYVNLSSNWSPNANHPIPNRFWWYGYRSQHFKSPFTIIKVIWLGLSNERPF